MPPPAKASSSSAASAAVSGGFPLAKKLAHNSLRVRNRAIKVVRRWLSKRVNVTDVDLLKLWEGLFYCFWMSDKVPVQQELAERLTGLMDDLADERALIYIGAFWDTMVRKWTGIDRSVGVLRVSYCAHCSVWGCRLRMDKFMSLVRKAARHVFHHLRRRKWSGASIQSVLQMLTKPKAELNGSAPAQWNAASGGVLLLNNDSARGLCLHVLDVWIAELSQEANASVSCRMCTSMCESKVTVPSDCRMCLNFQLKAKKLLQLMVSPVASACAPKQLVTVL